MPAFKCWWVCRCFRASSRRTTTQWPAHTWHSLNICRGPVAIHQLVSSSSHSSLIFHQRACFSVHTHLPWGYRGSPPGLTHCCGPGETVKILSEEWAHYKCLYYYFSKKCVFLYVYIYKAFKAICTSNYFQQGTSEGTVIEDHVFCCCFFVLFFVEV